MTSSTGKTVSLRALIYAPHGRDGAIAAGLAADAGVEADICGDVQTFGQSLGDSIAFAVVVEEAIRSADLRAIAAWLAAQPSWSDLPFIVLTQRGGGPERNPGAFRLSEVLGNVTFLERPFHPTTFLSVARTALKGRLRQYEARARIEDLHESGERLQTALLAGRLGSWSLDVATQTLECSDTCKAVFGRKPGDSFTYADLQASVHPDDRPRMASAVRQTMESGDDYAIEYRCLWPDGGIHWAEVRARLTGEEGGRARRLVGVSIDITDRKTAQERLQRLNETLEERVAARTVELERAHRIVLEESGQRARVEDALRQAQKMEAIGQLTGGVAHDFNNLLTVIRSSADLLRRPDIPEERRRRYVNAISDTADRAAKLTGQLLAFARRQALKPEVFNAARHVETIGDMLRTVLGARITLMIDVRSEECWIEADAGQFETALVNLAVNARDAMDGEGRLAITIDEARQVPAVRGHAGASGTFVSVAVSDIGVGIADADLARIFEPFFTTKEVGKGTGLGLSQVFGFTKQSGGEIDVTSVVGQGATFTLYMPRVAAVEPKDTVLPAQGQSPGRGRGRVLVVEDNMQVGEFATQLLTDLGYETTHAPNAADALAELESQSGRFDLVFSDVVMPGMSGVELGQHIRQRWPRLPIVLTSGYSHVLAEDARHGFELLRKPYSVEDLSRVLRAAARRRTPTRVAGG